MIWQMRWLGCGLVVGSLVSLASLPALAQRDLLTDAEVYRLRNNVQLLLRNQPPRRARVADRLVPQDALRTAINSVAELLFNEGSIARVDQNTTFRFQSGMRRFQLRNRLAMNETIFVLENGTALIISPPDSVGTQIQTPESRISILPGTEAAQRPAAPIAQIPLRVALGAVGSDVPVRLAQTEAPPDGTADLLPPPDRSSAVMAVHDAAQGVTQVFALTNDISVADRNGSSAVSLAGGQTVAAANGQLGAVQEFDLEAFYQSVPLAAGLGPDQESIVAQDPAAVQLSLNAVRPETLAAVRAQGRRLSGFGDSFLRDALGGRDSAPFERDFNGQRGEPSFAILEPEVTTGTFIRTGETSAVFIDDAGNQTPITVDFDDRTIRINGDAGIANSVGLSGNDASGTVIFQNGRATRIQVFDVNEAEPEIEQTYRGSLTTGIAPDR